MRELTVGDVMYLCQLRPDAYESSTTELLKRIIVADPSPRTGEVTDVLRWTVQERALAASRYISHIIEGDGDFSIGDGAKYSYFIIAGQDHPDESTEVGEVEGDHWRIRPLLGIHAEAIERLIAAGRLPSKRHGWWIGAMAAQLFKDGESSDQSDLSEVQIEERIDAFSCTLNGYPESAFVRLLFLYLGAIAKQNHIFQLEFSDDGIVFLSKEAEPSTARFPATDAISQAARQIFGKSA